MSTQVQYRRGTATENNAFTGALAEITVDTTNWTLRVHDGLTAGGGGNIATVAYVSAQLAALSANAITFGTSNVQIPSSGSNIRINVGGTSNVGVFSSTGLAITGDLSVTGNATLSGNILGDRVQNGTTSFDIQTTNGNANITIGGTSNVAVFSTTGANITGTLGVTGNITGGNLSGTSIVGTLTTAAQTNITSVGTLGSLAVTGNITGGNVNTAGKVTASTIESNVSTGTAPLTVSSTTLVTNLNADLLDGLNSASTNTVSTIVARDASGNFAAGTITATLSGAATTAGTVTTAAQPNITSTGTLSSLSVTGNITSSTGHVGTIYTNSIINTGANATGNIGSSTLYFNTAFVKATSAQYADLAEMYVADSDYQPGTVVEFGGNFEITQTTTTCSTAVAGIISTSPSYLMNATQSGEYVLPVALTGRVPCQVLGPIKKGDILISSNIPGVAQRIGTDWQPGCTVGKAMENISEAVVQTIEVAVGRL